MPQKVISRVYSTLVIKFHLNIYYLSLHHKHTESAHRNKKYTHTCQLEFIFLQCRLLVTIRQISSFSEFQAGKLFGARFPSQLHKPRLELR